MLLQAQNSSEPVNVDVLRAQLVDELHIPADQVKVATGTQRELDGLDLSRRDCPVRYIITVQALREGWDCPFAYILCSVQSIRSATAVEQLLGRILRMPYAARRTRPALNKAYAHVTEAQTGLAANALADRLIDGMGFDPLDMASMVAPMLPFDLATPRDDGPLFAACAAALALPSLQVDLPAGKPLPPSVADAVSQGLATVSTDGDRQRVQLRGSVPDTLPASWWRHSAASSAKPLHSKSNATTPWWRGTKHRPTAASSSLRYRGCATASRVAKASCCCWSANRCSSRSS